ncbi:MAG: response regulator [Burkholderiaceae bacterium]
MKPKVVIVEDQADIRKLIRMTLELEDFELHEADRGDAAWSLIQKLQPALALLDVMMPGGLDGYQLCEKIKMDPELAATTKVIVLTARTQQADLERGRQAGCDAYLVKPFSPGELLDTVARLVLPS